MYKISLIIVVISAFILGLAIVFPKAGKRLFLGGGSQMEVKKVTYDTKDKTGNVTKTSARVVIPDTQDRPLGAVIWNHGSWGICTNVSKLKDFASLGYVAIGPDYQGCEGLGEFDHLGTEIFDVIGALDWLKSRPDLVDASHIYMVGHSRGGAITLRTLNELGKLGRASDIRAAVVSGSVYASDLSLASRNKSNPEITQMKQDLMAKYNLSDTDLDELYRERSPDRFANRNNIVTPLFIAHGSEDERVLPENAQRMHNDLEAQGLEVRLKYYPGAGHNFQGAVLEEFLQDCKKWFTLHE